MLIIKSPRFGQRWLRGFKVCCLILYYQDCSFGTSIEGWSALFHRWLILFCIMGMWYLLRLWNVDVFWPKVFPLLKARDCISHHILRQNFLVVWDGYCEGRIFESIWGGVFTARDLEMNVWVFMNSSDLCVTLTLCSVLILFWNSAAVFMAGETWAKCWQIVVVLSQRQGHSSLWGNARGMR